MKKKVVQEEIEALKAQLARALADYDNLKKRSEREKEFLVRYANQGLIEKLLPGIQLLDKAQQHVSDPGVGVAISQLKQAIKEAGVLEIVPRPGEKFDETRHEAIETVAPTDDKMHGTIVELVKTGAEWKDRTLIIPAQVKVYGKGEKEEELKKEMMRGDYV